MTEYGRLQNGPCLPSNEARNHPDLRLPSIRPRRRNRISVTASPILPAATAHEKDDPAQRASRRAYGAVGTPNSQVRLATRLCVP